MGASATEIQFTDVFFVLTPCVVAQAIQTLFHHSKDNWSIFIFIINLFQILYVYEFCSIANVNTFLINIIGIHFTSILVFIVSYFYNTAIFRQNVQKSKEFMIVLFN